MNLQRTQIHLAELSKFINNIHNQQPTTLSNGFNSLFCDPKAIALIKVLNLCITKSTINLPHLKQRNSKVYFQRKDYVIRNQVKIIGQITKIIGKINNFPNVKQKHLAQFSTQNFYNQMQKQNNSYLYFLIGIFPKINVHKDNVPLFMPYLENPQSYKMILGNPNWEMSRQILNVIYKNEIIGSQEDQQNWYLLLTANKKVLQRYTGSNLQKIWVNLYYFYINETLKPYRTTSQTFSLDPKVTIESIRTLIQFYKESQQQTKSIILYSLILYLLSGNLQTLTSAFDLFCQYFKQMYLSKNKYQINQQQFESDGLINAQFCQIFNNLKEEEIVNETHYDFGIEKVQHLLKISEELNNIYLSKKGLFHDFYLRIIYPSNKIGDQINQNQTNDLKILQIMKKQMQKNHQVYPFPRYPYFSDNFKTQISKLYEQKYPNQLLQVISYLPPQTSVWKILNSQKLCSYKSYQEIKKQLKQKKQVYIKVIQDSFQITDNDFDNFIKIWQKYHSIFDSSKNQLTVKNQIEKVKSCTQIINSIVKLLQKTSTQFMDKVSLPFKKSSNVKLTLEQIFDGFSDLIQFAQYDEGAKIFQTYSNLLLSSQFKQHIISVLDQNQFNQFWLKWSQIYLSDNQLVKQIICLKEQNEEIEVDFNNSRLQSNPKEFHQVMQLQ